MKAFLLRTMALAAVGALIVFAACSDDESPTGTGGGGGGGSFSLSPGTYNTNVSLETCSGVPVLNEPGVEVWCKTEVIDELPGGLACTPTKVNADSVIVNCSGTANELACTFDYTATGNGSRNGNMWTLNVHVEISNQSPPSCFNDSTCFEMVLSAEWVEGPPTACNYADVNRFEATVVGGPMAGKVPFYMSGNASTDPGGILWYAYGQYPEPTFIAAAPSGLGEGWSFGMDLSAIDPKSLPAEVTVVASGIRTQSGTQGGNFVYYNEYNAQQQHEAYSSGGGGTVIVQEISEEHIAGTMDLNLEVTTYTGPQATGAQITSPRDISGGFYIRNQSPPNSASQFAAELGRRMLRSLQYVE